jgi:hypothetical protein
MTMQKAVGQRTKVTGYLLLREPFKMSNEVWLSRL